MGLDLKNKSFFVKIVKSNLSSGEKYIFHIFLLTFSAENSRSQSTWPGEFFGEYKKSAHFYKVLSSFIARYLAAPKLAEQQQKQSSKTKAASTKIRRNAVDSC